jgi:hypothetical protein
LVKQLINGIGGTERLAAALEIRLQDLLLGAADVLLSQGLIQKALPMYRLAKVRSTCFTDTVKASGCVYNIMNEMLSDSVG